MTKDDSIVIKFVHYSTEILYTLIKFVKSVCVFTRPMVNIC